MANATLVIIIREKSVGTILKLLIFMSCFSGETRLIYMENAVCEIPLQRRRADWNQLDQVVFK